MSSRVDLLKTSLRTYLSAVVRPSGERHNRIPPCQARGLNLAGFRPSAHRAPSSSSSYTTCYPYLSSPYPPERDGACCRQQPCACGRCRPPHTGLGLCWDSFPEFRQSCGRWRKSVNGSRSMETMLGLASRVRQIPRTRRPWTNPPQRRHRP